MKDAFQPRLDFSQVETLDDPAQTFVVDLDGYEGPLHVLLALARTQKVDLLKLSITTLANQYLAFVQEARRKDVVLAADYLVMASWLALLKSRLLLPRAEIRRDDEPEPADLAAQLTHRLARLEAMRDAGEALMARAILDRDVFTRGDPDARVVVPSDRVDVSLYDLMSAYVWQRQQAVARTYAPGARIEAFGLEAARTWLAARVDDLGTWTDFDTIVPISDRADGPTPASFTASTLAAGLELVREGDLDMRQDAPFEAIWIKARAPTPEAA